MRRTGVDAHTCADLVQDVAERALRSKVAFVDSDDLLRWCRAVLRNLLIDRHRRSGRVVLGAVPDVPSRSNVEALVEAADTARRLEVGLAALSEDDRVALLGNADGRPLSSAERVRRHRARSRLAKMLAGAGAWLGWVLRLLRRSRAGRAHVAVALLPTIALVAMLIPALGSASAETVPAPRPPRRPSPSTLTLHGPASPRTKSAASVPAASTRPTTPRRRDRPVPLPEGDVRVPTPIGARPGVGTRTEPPAPIYCVWNAPVIGDACTPF